MNTYEFIKIQDKHLFVIDRILSEFDFEKVESVMKFLNWKWGLYETEHQPTIEELKEVAKNLMLQAIGDTALTVSKGGFDAYWEPKDESLSLSFSIEGFGAYYDEAREEVMEF